MMTGQRQPRGKLGFRIQARDVAIVEVVHRMRVLSSEHVAALLFGQLDGAGSYCRKRLQLLAEAGYLDRREQLQTRTEGRKPYLYFLAPAGVELLVSELGLEPETIDWRPSYNDVQWPYLRHQLAINDAHVAVSLAAPAVGWRFSDWTDDRMLRKTHTERFPVTGHDGRIAETVVVPDAHFFYEAPDPATGEVNHPQFFLECDLATEVVAARNLQRTSWQRKIRAYQAYFASGAAVARYRTNRIRVLTVTTGAMRLANLKAVTEEEGGRSRYWFTTADALTPATALQEPIWYKAGSSEPVRLAR